MGEKEIKLIKFIHIKVDQISPIYVKTPVQQETCFR